MYVKYICGYVLYIHANKENFIILYYFTLYYDIKIRLRSFLVISKYIHTYIHIYTICNESIYNYITSKGILT